MSRLAGCRRLNSETSQDGVLCEEHEGYEWARKFHEQEHGLCYPQSRAIWFTQCHVLWYQVTEDDGNEGQEDKGDADGESVRHDSLQEEKRGRVLPVEQ